MQVNLNLKISLYLLLFRCSINISKFISIRPILQYKAAKCLFDLNKGSEASLILIELMNTSQNYIPFNILYDNFFQIFNSIKDGKFKRDSLISVYKCLKKNAEISEWKDLDNLKKLAKISFDLQEYNFSINVHEKIFEIDSKDISILVSLVQLYISVNDFEKLGKVYLKLGNYLKEQIKPYEEYSEDDHESNINKCLSYFYEALKLLPNNVDVLVSLSEIHRIIDKNKESLGFIDHALKINDKDYRVYYEGFLAYEEIGDYHTAKEMIRICLILNIKFVQGFNAFGNLMRKEKNYELAIALFETALTREPENVPILNNYATCHLEMGNKSRAKEIYLQAYHLDNNLFEINCNLSNLYCKECKKNYKDKILIFLFLDNYEKALEHISKAKELEPENAKVYNILSSIYNSVNLKDSAISSLKYSINLDARNLTSYVQLANNYKQICNYTECINLCLHVIRQNPKFTEAFLLYLESLQSINSWNDLEENMKTLNSIVEYHHHLKNMNTQLNFFIADFYVKNLDQKLWIYDINCQQDIRDVKFAFDEIPNYEYENSLKRFSSYKPLKIGYLIEDIKDEYTFKLVLKMLNYNKNKIKNNYYFILFESEKEEVNNTNIPLSFNWKDKIKNLSSFYEIKIIDLTYEDNPKSKAELLFKLEFDALIFLENLVYNPYNNILCKKIYQTLALKPAKIQILLPYNGCPRIGENKIFDYVISNKFNNFIGKFKERIILIDSPLFCLNPYEENFEEDLECDPFVNFKSINIKILANFSECFKIDVEIFKIWCEILDKVRNTVLVLKFCNDESVNNLKSFAKQLGIDANRILFFNFNSDKSEFKENTNTSTCSIPTNNFNYKYASNKLIKFIDLYLDVQTFTSDLEMFFCNFQNIPSVSVNTGSYPITSSLSQTVGNNKYCTNIHDYKNNAIYILNNNEFFIPKKLEYSTIDKFIDSLDDSLDKIKLETLIENIDIE